jgi:hypothetical protein
VTHIRRNIAIAGRSNALPPNPETWRDRALCAGMVTSPDDDLWFSSDEADVAEATRICGMCPVRPDCKAAFYNLEPVQQHGIWGGPEPTARTDIPVVQRGALRWEMYRAGMTDAEIADREGSPPARIMKWRHANKLPMNRVAS